MNKNKIKYEKKRVKSIRKEKEKLERECILIKDWEELSKIKESKTHILEINIEFCNGWIKSKYDDNDIYLSTHTFYGKTHKYSTETLRSCGFKVTIDNWDKNL